jgi:haloalkane dehalogenase
MMPNTGWLDRSLYPFESHWLEVDEGRMHYVDEGSGSPVLLVHGTPTWSFLYRDLIKHLTGTHRVIAPDHLGFGLSDKPGVAPYRPEDHARRLAALVEHLGLENLTLVVHDFGGPIGLSYATDHPGNVPRLVLFNTWMWSLADNPRARWGGRLLGSPLGRLLYTRWNLSPRVILPSAYGDRSKLTSAIHRHYLAPFPTPATRAAPAALARELIGSSDFYDSLWQRRDAIRDKPTLIVWGMKDPTFPESHLERWERFFTRVRVVRLPQIGHFVPEEAPGVVGPLVEEFLAAG